MPASKNRHLIGPRPDPHPEIPAAGRTMHQDPDNTAKDCLKWGRRAMELDNIRPVGSPVGGRNQSKDAEMMQRAPLTHGVVCDRTHTAAEVIFPARQNPLLSEREANREAIYHRKEHQVLGRSANKDPALPEFTNDPQFKYGKATRRSEGVADIMHPPVPPMSAEELSEEDRIHRLYILSHSSYRPGERRMHYGPGWKVPNDQDTFVRHRLDNDGSRVRNTMYWEEEHTQELRSKLISSRLADFRERQQPEIGKVHDPIKSTIAHLSPNHTFGISFPADEYTVCDLLGYRHPKPTAVVEKDKTKLPQQLGDQEDKSVPLKITEDVPGGVPNPVHVARFDVSHAFGVPTVRDPRGRLRTKKLADFTNYGDELGAKGLMYPTPRNVFGLQQLREFERQINAATSAKVAAV
ncbi:hypothetical protein BC831DRAFT_440097 [Entophlyctis helioformis]|nr:hypothetical protein BC831DRAFT_440097 [Entophlyctis helioformis]